MFHSSKIATSGQQNFLLHLLTCDVVVSVVGPGNPSGAPVLLSG